MDIIMTSPPATTAVALADVKAQLNIDTADDDTRLTGLILAATETVETHIGRALITRSYSGYLNWWPSSPEGHVRSWINLEKPPLVSVSAITSYDDSDVGTVYPAANYYVDTIRTPGRVMLRRGQIWPIPLRMANGIQIDWTCGYGADPSFIPPTLKLAIQVQVGVLNEARGDETSAQAMHPTVELMLSPYLFSPPS